MLLLSTLTATLGLLALGAWVHQLPGWVFSGMLAANFVVVLGLLESHARRRAWRRLRAREQLPACPQLAVTAGLMADDETELLAAEDLTGQGRRLSA